ncbi:hypothetical protein RclHR1_11540007 [Rhizophagus clarus]|uniref:MACPF-like domain-containing protein n=1 Tax=Rhizophagus clarus TaxID=94130 RepID=A0A2Z6Q4N9_9GLOM|nr:hypothetical protein RclHR1_11540007 [Rhizophagus clarus]GES87546.1 hypothetical protein GLOIN_2v1471642 [Rhizophagus clarus]
MNSFSFLLYANQLTCFGENIRVSVSIEIEPYEEKGKNRYKRTFNRNASLFKVRQELCEDEDIKMGSNMYFLDNQKDIIRKSDEKEIKLTDNIYENVIYILHKVDELDWNRIVRDNNLEYGVNFTAENNTVSAKSKAFKIMEDPIKIVKSNYSSSLNKDDEQGNKMTNQEKKSAGFGSSLLAQLGISAGTTHDVDTVTGNSSTSTTHYRQEAIITLTMDKIEPTDEFEKAVDEVIHSNSSFEEKRKSLDIIKEEYGSYWYQTIYMGGKLDFHDTKSKTSEITDSSTQAVEIKLELSVQPFNASCASTNNINDSKRQEEKNELIHFTAIGGTYYGNHQEWIKSLEDYTKWGVIKRDNVTSIFDILDEGMQKEIKRIFTQVILQEKTELVKEFELEPQQNFQVIDFHVNLKETEQLFANVLSDEFALQIDCKNKDKPSITLYRIKPQTGKKKYNNIEIQWVKVGMEC